MSTPECCGVRRRGPRFGILGVTAAVLLVVSSGCRSSGSSSIAAPSASLEEGVAVLIRPLPGPMSALYRMEVPSSGGFRFSIAAVEGGNGRMTVSEPFGGAVLLAGWAPSGIAEVFDLREGCRIVGGAVPSGLGLDGLPLRRMFRLLGGRLPTLAGDVPEIVSDREVVIDAAGGEVRATLADDPWRVVRVEGEGFSVTLDSHTSSFPGRIRFEADSGDSAELEIVRLEWEHAGEWPPLPDLPVCGSR